MPLFIILPAFDLVNQNPGFLAGRLAMVQWLFCRQQDLMIRILQEGAEFPGLDCLIQ